MPQPTLGSILTDLVDETHLMHRVLTTYLLSSSHFTLAATFVAPNAPYTVEREIVTAVLYPDALERLAACSPSRITVECGFASIPVYLAL